LLLFGIHRGVESGLKVKMEQSVQTLQVHSTQLLEEKQPDLSNLACIATSTLIITVNITVSLIDPDFTLFHLNENICNIQNNFSRI
jgi:hypothetical protein